MKRFLFMSALASVALASCVNDEVMENTSKASDQKITFNAPVVSGTTRAVAGEQPGSDGKYNIAEKFRVYAQWDYDGTFEHWITANSDKQALYMSNVEVAYDSEKQGWTSNEPVYYWPKTGALTFAAYSPSDVNSFNPTYSDAGLSVNGFTVEDLIANQYDFMYSERSKNCTNNTDKYILEISQNKSYTGVDILFKHALSSIHFKVKAADIYTGTTIRVKQVTILNAYSKGDFAEDLNDANSDGVKASWSNLESIKNYAVKTNADNQVLSSGEAVPLSGANGVILLPQALKHSDTEHVKVKVDYSIQNRTGPELIQVAELDLVTGNNNGYYKDGSVDIDEWEMGKRYTYTINIGLDKIYFSPEVVNWVDVTVTPDLTI